MTIDLMVRRKGLDEPFFESNAFIEIIACCCELKGQLELHIASGVP